MKKKQNKKEKRKRKRKRKSRLVHKTKRVLESTLFFINNNLKTGSFFFFGIYFVYFTHHFTCFTFTSFSPLFYPKLCFITFTPFPWM
jgi:hypothetical protein